MLALKILGVIAAIICLIMLIPIGADVAYIGGELAVSAKVSKLKLQIIPGKDQQDIKPAKKKKTKKEKKPKADVTNEQAQAKGKKLNFNFNFDEILGLVKAVLKGFGKFGRKLRVERFLLHYTAAGKDPYSVAVTFGRVNAALNSLAPVCSARFDVKDLDVYTNVDFMAEKMSVDFAVALTIRIGQIFGVIFTIIIGALAILIKNKFRLRKENKTKDTENTNNDTNTENSLTEEERTENG